jgi:hypothetical protein
LHVYSGAERSKEDSSFSEEKEAKRLLSIWLRDPIRIGSRLPSSKSFLVLFFKKELLSLS